MKTNRRNHIDPALNVICTAETGGGILAGPAAILGGSDRSKDAEVEVLLSRRGSGPRDN
ncbi:MAG: hypothetical protein PVS2B2_26730 [Candidatus Acidiferrum sp.]